MHLHFALFDLELLGRFLLHGKLDGVLCAIGRVEVLGCLRSILQTAGVEAIVTCFILWLISLRFFRHEYWRLV